MQGPNLTNPSILVANTNLSTDRVKLPAATITQSNLFLLDSLQKKENAHLRAKLQSIIDLHPNLVVNRQIVYDYPNELLTDHSINLVENTDFENTEKVAAFTNASIVSLVSDTLNTQTNSLKISLGTCRQVSTFTVASHRMTRFSYNTSKETSSTPPTSPEQQPDSETQTKYVSMVLRAPTANLLKLQNQLVENVLAGLHNAIDQKSFVFGAGFCEAYLSNLFMSKYWQLSSSSSHMDKPQQLVFLALATVFQKYIAILANNASFDGSSLGAELVSSQKIDSSNSFGLDLSSGAVVSNDSIPVMENVSLKLSIINAAIETVVMILRIDSILYN
eukprot:GHVN01047463.1.p1 GENE.GHVN01047463.1~~GHVN01047463.1.p1  ORF type:complete len:333 (+),score=31.18 GHVN01047463.1:468-1466(+)